MQAARCAYAILVMAVYWMTEVVPMAITALLPIVLMPWFGIMDSRKVCENYLKVSVTSCHFNEGQSLWVLLKFGVTGYHFN